MNSKPLLDDVLFEDHGKTFTPLNFIYDTPHSISTEKIQPSNYFQKYKIEINSILQEFLISNLEWQNYRQKIYRIATDAVYMAQLFNFCIVTLELHLMRFPGEIRDKTIDLFKQYPYRIDIRDYLEQYKHGSQFGDHTITFKLNALCDKHKDDILSLISFFIDITNEQSDMDDIDLIEK